MASLVLASSYTDRFAEEIIRLINRENGNVTVVSTFAEVNIRLKEAGIPSQHMLVTPPENRKERDESFADLAMPGALGGYDFPDTTLPVWQVLSIDRLSFWYEGEKSDTLLNLVDSLDWDTLLTDIHIYSHYPFAAAHLAKKRGARTIGVVTTPVYDIEYRRIKKNLGNLFDEVIQEKQQSPQEIGVDPTFKRGLTGNEFGQQLGVVFDARHEWETRRFLRTSPNAIVIVTNQRDEDVAKRVLAGKRIFGIEAAKAADSIIAFKWHEGLPKRTQILSVRGHETGPVEVVRWQV